jgi:hypothetical protein
MRDFKIFTPADCVVSNTAAENEHALRQIRTVMKGNVAVSTRLMFRGRSQSKKSEGLKANGRSR